MRKSTVVAILVFIALLVGAYYSLNQKPERGITRVSFADLDPASIDRVEISGKNPIELKREGELWKLGNGKEADEGSVTRLIEKIPEIISTHVVTKDPARFAELELDEATGSHVKAFAGGNLVADLVVGKSGSGGAHVLVDGAVYLVKGVYAGVFSKPASAWHQLKLFKDKLEEVTRVEVALGGAAPYALVKQEEAWALEDASVLPEGFRFDANVARSLVSTLVNCRAGEVLEADPGAETTGLGAGADGFVFVGADGARRALSLGVTTDDKKVYAQVAGKPDVYTLPEHTAKNLRKAVTDLRDLKLVKLDKAAVRRLQIKGEGVSHSFIKQGNDWKIDKSSDEIPADFELDMMAVHRKIQALETTRALRLADPAVTLVKAGLIRPKTTVEARYEDGTSFTLAFGAEFKDDDRDVVYAKGTIDDALYVVGRWTRDNLVGPLEKYRKRADQGMPNIDPSALQNLPPDVRENLMKQLQQKQAQQQMMQQLQAQMDSKQKAEGAKAPAAE